MTDPFEPISDEQDHRGPGEVAGNVDAIARLFPDAVVDGTVDLDVLADLLGQDSKRGDNQGFGLRWPGMDEARRLSAVSATQTLLPRPDESVDWDTTSNIVIEGDNLEVLRLLRRGYSGKVDLIYIDPPYNTGNDFIYDDNYSATRAETESVAGQRDESGVTENGSASDLAADRRAGASRHSRWLSMMYPRLLLAHHLLKETGIFIAAIDDTEMTRLKLVLDRVFGAENFISTIVWQGVRKNDARYISDSHDYMLIYAKNEGGLRSLDTRWRARKDSVDEVLQKVKELFEQSKDPVEATRLLKKWYTSERHRLSASITNYNQIDSQGRVFYAGDLRSPNPRQNLMYDLLHPTTGQPVRRHPNGWVYSAESMKEKIAEGRILFGRDHTTLPYYKRFLTEQSEEAVLSVFEQPRRTASQALEKLLGSKVFDFPKDKNVLSRWVDLVAPSDALVVDFFAGSGSTAHAVMDLNAIDQGNRRWIMVQVSELVDDENYQTIPEITRERLRRAGKQIAVERVVNSATTDLGFRSYRLASSNVRPWDGTGELNLLEAADNLVDGRSTDDLLVEMMLRLGVDLVTPVEAREVAGSTLYSLAGTLFAHFGVDLDASAATQVAEAVIGWRDEDPVDSEVTVVVRDTGFRDSEAKLNLAAALRQAGVTTLRSI